MNDTDCILSTPHALMARFCQLVGEGDLDGLVALYEADALFRPSEGRVARGHTEIRAALADLLALRPTLDARVEDILETGDVALVTSTWQLRGTAPDGTAVEQAGRSFDVFRRHPHGWAVVIDRP